MSALIRPLRHAFDSAQKFLTPGKRKREEGTEEGKRLDENDVGVEMEKEQSGAEEKGSVAGLSVQGGEVERGTSLKRQALGDVAPVMDDHVHSGDGRVGDAAEREDMQAQSVEKSAFSPLKPQWLRESTMSQKSSAQKKRPFHCASVLDQYAYLKSVEKYENSVRTSWVPVNAKTTGALSMFPNDMTSRRLSYGTPQRPVALSSAVTTTSPRDEFERARWIEQRKLEEENRALRRRIDEIERRAAPAPATTNTSDSMVVGDLLGDGVNDELIQQKLAKLQVPIPALQAYKRRQALRQSEIASREKTLLMLRTSLRTQQEQIAHEDYLRSIETEVVEDEIEEGGDVIDLLDDDVEGVDELESAEESLEDQDGFVSDDNEVPDDFLDDDALVGVSVVDEMDSFSKLTDDAEARVSRALSEIRPRKTVLVTLQNMTLERNDMLRLRPNQWLNDELMNCYIALLQERNARGKEENLEWPDSHFFTTFFYTRLVNVNDQEAKYDYASVRRWTRKVDIFSKDRIIIPINLQNVHWACAVIDMRDRKFTYLDSMGGANKKVLSHLQTWLEDESRDKRKVVLDCAKEGWVMDFPGRSVPQQANGDDCGVFACKFADFSGRDEPFSFSANDMVYFRRRMAAELIAKRVS